MKFTCGRDELLTGFQLVSSVVPQKSTIPTLQNVKIAATGGKKKNQLEMVGTDMEVGIRYTIRNVQVDEAGTLVIPASRLTGILRESQADAVEVTSDNTVANIAVGSGRYKVVGTDPVDYPAFPTLSESNEVEISAEEISTMIARTLFATSTEMTRYALTGVLFEFDKKGFRLVASDGKRLALAQSKSAKNASSVKIIVPPKALNLLNRVLTDEDKTISLQFDENQLKIKTANAEIFTRLIEGNFPDYNAVIPKDNDKKLNISRDQLERSIRQVNPLVTEKTKAVKFTFDDSALTLFTKSADVGEATVGMDVEYAGDEFDIVFNPEFVLDFLKTIDKENVEVEMKNRTAAGIFRDGKEYTYVVMPLTINL
jgi:DNA polymerase-3 subunit beta